MASEVRRQPAVVVVPEHVGQVLMQGAAVRHVEQLHTAADAEQREVVLLRAACQRELEGVAAGFLGGGRGVRALSVAARRDVAPTAAEDHAVQREEQVLGVRGVLLVGDEQDRAGARTLDGPHVGDGRERGVLVPAARVDVGDAAGDPDRGADGRQR